MTEVIETQLPGVGVRHEFMTAAGERRAVLSHRTGRRDTAVYDRADPDACSTVLHLSSDDNRTLAELLGGSPVSEAVTGVQRLEDVAIDWIRIRPGSEQTGATIGEGRLRTRTGSSVVALVRGDDTLPARAAMLCSSPATSWLRLVPPTGLLQLRDLLDA